MIITNKLSKKITFFTILLTLFVVFLHTSKYDIYNSISDKFIFIKYVVTFISIGIARTAVPLFFCISGFLFFKGVNKFTAQDYSVRFKKRIHTLLIPYILTSIISFSIYVLLFNALGITHPIFELNTTWDSFYKLFNVIFIKPMAYQLWFIQYLILLCLVSPVIYILLKKAKVIYLLIIGIVWLIWSPHILALCLVFFSLGGYFSLQEKPFYESKTKLLPLILIAIWFILVYFTEINPLFDPFINNILINIYTIAGIAGMWLLYDFGDENTIDKITNSPIAKYSFIIYLFHEPFLNFFIPFAFKILGINTLTGIIVYIASPLLAVCLSMLLGYLLFRFTPKAYSLITGNR